MQTFDDQIHTIFKRPQFKKITNIFTWWISVVFYPKLLSKNFIMSDKKYLKKDCKF